MRYLAAAAVWLAAMATPAAASAQSPVPQANSTCPAEAAGALTRTTNAVLHCQGSIWQVLDDPYPHSDRWFTYGPALTLHGEAQPNRELDSGDWLATPQDSSSRCSATQTAIADTGSLGPPQTSSGQTGRPLTVRLQPLLFTVDLSGPCLWQKVR
jgi:hypothetical protein